MSVYAPEHAFEHDVVRAEEMGAREHDPGAGRQVCWRLALQAEKVTIKREDRRLHGEGESG